jgi:tetratricopeptide (TPR) repeat protein
MSYDSSKPLKFAENFTFDKNLREVVRYPTHVLSRIRYLTTRLDGDLEVTQQVRHLAEVGVLYRVMGNLEIAESCLVEALGLIKKFALNPMLVVQCGVRLGHVWQWQQRFEESNSIFPELIEICQVDSECRPLLDFVYQHYGKNLFDQKRYTEALQFFEMALSIRQQGAEQGLADSTQQAIAVVRTKLALDQSKSPV